MLLSLSVSLAKKNPEHAQAGMLRSRSFHQSTASEGSEGLQDVHVGQA